MSFYRWLQGAINSTISIDVDDVGIPKDTQCRGVVILFVQAADGGIPRLMDTTTVRTIFGKTDHTNSA